MIKTVLVEDLGRGVRKVSLNRPERLNAIVPQLLEELIAALSEADRDPDTRALVLTGEGRAFCAGDDLKEFAEQAAESATTAAYVERIQDVTRRILLGDKPVVGAIRGWAVGGGLEWMINCDFAIAAEGTRFFFPEVSWGLFVTGGVTWLLPRLAGLQRARALILLGEKFDACQALDWGLLHAVVPDAELVSQATALAQRLAAMPAGPVKALRRILAGQEGESLAAAMAAESGATVEGFLEPETAKRIAGFR